MYKRLPTRTNTIVVIITWLTIHIKLNNNLPMHMIVLEGVNIRFHDLPSPSRFARRKDAKGKYKEDKNSVRAPVMQKAVAEAVHFGDVKLYHGVRGGELAEKRRIVERLLQNSAAVKEIY